MRGSRSTRLASAWRRPVAERDQRRPGRQPLPPRRRLRRRGRLACPAATTSPTRCAARRLCSSRASTPSRRRRALGEFPGVVRRLELKGERNGAASTTTTPTTRPRWRHARGRARARPARLIAVFQPHLYSRTKALASEFGAALAAADEIGGARRLSGPRASRWGRLRASAASWSPRRPPTAPGASRCGGCRRRAAAEALAPRPRRGRPAGHDRRRRHLPARRGAGRRGTSR